MPFRGSMLAMAGLLASLATAQAFDDAKYPDLFGVWRRLNLRPGGQPSFDPTKPWGKGQQAPLTPEYQAIHEASLADQANGGQGNWQSGARCMPPGMPASMTAYGEMEIVVLPDVTHVLLNHNSSYHRRIYTDGRDWPTEIEPSFQGYSIGKWIGEDGSGPGTSRARGRSTRPACRSMPTTSRSSRSASFSTRPIRPFCTTRSR